jgi:hypothetical protein
MQEVTALEEMEQSEEIVLEEVGALPDPAVKPRYGM